MSHGILLVDKPSGLTSHDVVAKMRRALGTKSIGHAGTLDPLATGLMVLLVGEATKISDYLLNGEKGYRVKIRFGMETDSLDITGQVTKVFPNFDLNSNQIENKMQELMGTLQLQVPKFSATKIGGEKLLQKALRHEDFEAPIKEMRFYDLKIFEVQSDSATCEFKCSKGSFVRSWVQELGVQLGCGAVVEELRRYYSQPFDVSQTTTLMDLLNLSSQEISNLLIPLENCLLDWDAMTVNGKDERLMKNGQVPNELTKRLIFQQKLANRTLQSLGIRVFQASDGMLSSLIEVQPFKEPKIKRVFRY